MKNKEAEKLVSGRITFKGRMAKISVAVSFFVVTLSVAVSAGFRKEIRTGLAEMAGDVRLTSNAPDLWSGTAPFTPDSTVSGTILSIGGTRSASEVICRAGIVRNADVIHGVLFKGEEGNGLGELEVSIPSRLSRITGLGEGDRMLAYFVSDKVKARKFTIREVHDAFLEKDDNLIVFARMEDLRSVNGWEEGEISAIEIILDDKFRSREALRDKSAEIGMNVPYAVASSSEDRYPQMFDWLQLIDTNVVAILLLMAIVAAVNMTSALLILLFRHIGTIGMLKALGMTGKSISRAFLRLSSRTVAIGIAEGTLAAALFCIVQSTTHFLKLNPDNYFVSFVPVSLNIPATILADILGFLVIMGVLRLTSSFISKVDPAETVKVK